MQGKKPMPSFLNQPSHQKTNGNYDNRQHKD
jgi:hypothetical protein